MNSKTPLYCSQIKTNLSLAFLSNERGIAIGPILFVVAILGILAAAISAGSGSFTMGSSAENNRTKASAMIEIGQNIKIGMERIVGEQGVDVLNVDINPANTSLSNQLYAPIGGGIASPSVTMAGNAQSDRWYYPQGFIPGLGTGTGSYYDKLAILNVSLGVCQEINNKIFGNNTIPTLNMANTALAVNAGNFAVTAWNNTTAYAGKPQGCVKTNDNIYYFYQVIGIQ
jgi:hypothetical protein